MLSDRQTHTQTDRRLITILSTPTPYRVGVVIVNVKHLEEHLKQYKVESNLITVVVRLGHKHAL